jgi:kinetochore protein NDC80
VSDKAFVAGCTQTLITYLATHGYDRPLSPKLLSSNKEFGAVVAFLARRVDPGAPPLSGRVEDEVPALFKRLRYPFAIPKSALQAVGSPHTWPALVAALAWLVELLQYAEHAALAAPSAFEGDVSGGRGGGAPPAAQPEGERGFFDFCSASYAAYLAGDDARVAALDARLEAAYATESRALAGSVQRLEAEHAVLDERLQAARAAVVPLEALDAAKVSAPPRRPPFVKHTDSPPSTGTQAAHEADAAQLGTLIAQLRTHVGALQHKTVERRAEVEAREAEVAAAHADNAALAAQVASQRVSSADVARMAADRAAQEALRAGVAAAATAAEEQARELAADAERCADEVDAALGAYHSAGLALKVLPAGAKRGRAGAYVLQALAPHVAPAAVLDAAAEALRSAIRPGLEALRDEDKARGREAGTARLRLDAELDASEALLATRRDERAALEAEVARAEGGIGQTKERIAAAVAAAEASAAAMEAQATALRVAAEASMQESEGALATQRAAYDDLAAHCAADAANTQQLLLAALDLMMRHKQAVQDALQRCSNVLAALGDDLGADVTQHTTHFPA